MNILKYILLLGVSSVACTVSAMENGSVVPNGNGNDTITPSYSIGCLQGEHETTYNHPLSRDGFLNFSVTQIINSKAENCIDVYKVGISKVVGGNPQFIGAREYWDIVSQSNNEQLLGTITKPDIEDEYAVLPFVEGRSIGKQEIPGYGPLVVTQIMRPKPIKQGPGVTTGHSLDWAQFIPRTCEERKFLSYSSAKQFWHESAIMFAQQQGLNSKKNHNS